MIQNKKSRYQRARKALIFWCLFIGIGAVIGGSMMLLEPTGRTMGMHVLLPCFQKLPFAEYLFQDFVFPGIALLIVNGISNLTAAVLLFQKKKSGILLGTLFGFTLMLWICIQFYIFPLNFMSTIYFIFGLIQLCTGYACWVFYQQEQFIVDRNEYTNIGTNKDLLVVYFSRMGYTKKLAYEAANESGAELYEIKTTEPTEGTAGFWWCGRFGIHRWDMPIESISEELSNYTAVTICTPVWIFHVAAPVKSFCQQVSGKIRKVEYILCHFQRCRYRNVVREMDQLLQITNSGVKSVCCRKGKYC